MKATEEEWITATAHAMSSPDTVRLFDHVPAQFELFALVSHELYDRIKGDDLTDNLVVERLVEVVEDILPDRKPTKVELLRAWALVSFETSVYKVWKAEKA
jgi:hypothetical protein